MFKILENVSLNSLYIFLIIFTFPFSLQSQTLYSKFGKNRVQYHDDFKDWWMYNTKSYTIYWYGKEKNTAISTFLLSQLSYSDIEELLDFKMNRKIQLIVYSDISDLKQTNIGLIDQQNESDAGFLKFNSNKIVIHFNGNHNDLLKQIRKGTAKVFIDNMFSTFSFDKLYKSFSSGNIPKWFIDGSIEYIADDWNIESNNRLRSLFNTNNNISFDQLINQVPNLAGRSFLNFIYQKYGMNSISDLYYFTRISLDLNSSLQNITSTSINQLYLDWESYYSGIYKQYDTNLNTQYKSIIATNKNNQKYTSLTISPNEKFLTYTVNTSGLKKLYLYNIDKRIKTLILKKGYINTFQPTDYNFPLAAFNKSSTRLAILYRSRNNISLKIINLRNFKEKITILPERFKVVYSFDYWDNNTLILNANTDGYDDIYFYDIKKRQSKRLTYDFWDDLTLKTCEFKTKKGVIFSSNRDNISNRIDHYDTITPLRNFDIYFLEPIEKKITKIVYSDSIDKFNANIIGNKIIFLSNENGINYIKQKSIDSLTTQTIVTNSTESIYSLASSDKYILYSSEELCDQKLYLEKINELPKSKILKYNLLSPYKRIKLSHKTSNIEIDSSLLFQTKFKEPPRLNESINNNNEDSKLKKKHIEKFIPSHAFAARLRFSFSNLITKVDNEPLFDGLSTYSEADPYYSPPETGLVLKSQIKDLFEDYFIEGGIRISSSLHDREYFATFDNLKNRIDWQFAFYRKTSSGYNYVRQNIIDKFSEKTNLIQIKAKYPFDIFKSISLTTKLRFDKKNVFASDTLSLNYPGETEQRLSLKLKFVYDNTSKISTNILNGTKALFFIEGYNKFNIKVNNPSTFNLSNGLMSVIGLDIRKYIPVYKNSIIAFRFTGQTSFGSESNLYFLGGVENWQFPKNSDLESINQDQIYAYKVLAANMRGFGYNARNGSSFLLFNSEIRIPIFKTIFATTSKYSFFNDLQLIGFFDTGLAWNGLTPYSTKNPSNTKIIDIPPVLKLKLKYYSDPLISSYGFGIRTTIFGYFIKFDYGWGIETKKILKPMYHLSTGFDF